MNLLSLGSGACARLSVTWGVLYGEVVTGQLIGQQWSRLQDDHSLRAVISHSAAAAAAGEIWRRDYSCWQSDAQLIIIICCPVIQ